MAVTIADVARKAGVTNGTVSRALNDYPDILPETKRRIMEAAQELGITVEACRKRFHRDKEKMRKNIQV